MGYVLVTGYCHRFPSELPVREIQIPSNRHEYPETRIKKPVARPGFTAGELAVVASIPIFKKTYNHERKNVSSPAKCCIGLLIAYYLQ